METFNIHEAKTKLSGILKRVGMGESFIIAKAGRPVAQITPLKAEESRPKARTGFLRGHISVPDDFDSMASEAVAELFEGQA